MKDALKNEGNDSSPVDTVQASKNVSVTSVAEALTYVPSMNIDTTCNPRKLYNL